MEGFWSSVSRLLLGQPTGQIGRLSASEAMGNPCGKERRYPRAFRRDSARADVIARRCGADERYLLRPPHRCDWKVGRYYGATSRSAQPAVPSRLVNPALCNSLFLLRGCCCSVLSGCRSLLCLAPGGAKSFLWRGETMWKIDLTHEHRLPPTAGQRAIDSRAAHDDLRR
jgi:hypothetical protein